MGLDRVREAQMQTHIALQHQGELLHDMVKLQQQVVGLQRETARAVASIKRDKASSPPSKSQPSWPPTGKDVIQWVAAVVMIAWVLRGGDPASLLKALGALSGV